MPVSLWILFGLFFVVTLIYSHDKRELNRWSLISKYPNDPSVSMSVPYTMEELKNGLKDIGLFISICELSLEMTNRIEHCVEELSFNIISSSGNTRHDVFFDVRVVYSPDDVLVILKDCNRPFNPIYVFKPGAEVTPQNDKIGLAMVNGMCQSINYKYMNGINCTYLRFPYCGESK